MPTYMLLSSWTDQGNEKFKGGQDRLREVLPEIDKAGVKIKDSYYMLGPYNIVSILEAPDEETVTALTLRINSLNFSHSKVVRVFNSDEFKDLIRRTDSYDDEVWERAAGID